MRSGTLAAQIQASQNDSKHEVDETIAELQGILAAQRRDAASFEADSDIDFVVKDLPTCIKGYAVSIIVTARNYGCFLRECLQSCIRQTVPVVDIIYSDDCSNDNSVAIAMSFPEVTVLAHKNHLGVCEARNRGVAACKGELLCHVDGDDILPDDFIQRHLEAIRDDIPFVYCAAQAFGLHESRWTAPSWRERSIWHNNYVNTSALIWRWAFEAAGKWQETASKTMWDWNLALRLSRFGVPAVSNATLLYRQHANSWSHKEQEEALLGEKWTSMLGPMRREVVRVSFCTVYSGRLPDLLPLWCQQVAFAAIDTGIKPEWLILDNSMDSGELLAQCTTRVQRAFSSIRIIPFKERRTWATEIERRNGVADFMARACTRLLREAKGELVYFIEDDVIVPRGGFGVLYHSITNGHPLTSAVAGLYRNRHAPSFVGGWFKPQVREIESEPQDSKPIAVDFTGTGCLLFWRPLCPDYFQSHINGIPAHDWWWGMELQRSGGSLLIMPKVRCRHYTTGDTWR